MNPISTGIAKSRHFPSDKTTDKPQHPAIALQSHGNGPASQTILADFELGLGIASSSAVNLSQSPTADGEKTETSGFGETSENSNTL